MMNVEEHIPVVIVHNYLETFREFLGRTGDDSVLRARRFNGDQALFWKGANKLVISSAPIENAAILMKRWGYENVISISPKQPSQQLSNDIRSEEWMLEQIVAFAGEEKRIRLIPYATTREFLKLAEWLRGDKGLIVETPESPGEEAAWLVSYMDSKSGFRTLITQWNIKDAQVPFGFICRDLEQAIAATAWFRTQGQGCVIKADRGGSGVGNLFMKAEELTSEEKVREKLATNAFLNEGMFVVEELVQSLSGMSPSLEYYVPRAEAGEPVMTYLSSQHFEESGQFAGVAISRELWDEDWCDGFVQAGMEIAREVQALGYVGRFDLDAIVDDAGEVYLVEINARRTGATYVDDFLRFMLSADYGERVAAFSQNKMGVGGMKTLAELEAAIGEVLYPIRGEERGVIVMLSSTLARGYFGYVAVGRDLDDVHAIRRKLARGLQDNLLKPK